MAINLNQSLLPASFVAEARVKLGGQVEIDVGTFAESGTGAKTDSGAVALWAPPKASATAPLDFRDPDVFEVQVLRAFGKNGSLARKQLVSFGASTQWKELHHENVGYGRPLGAA